MSLLFQFHKGTIKTLSQRLNLRKTQLFQFHKGTIKTRLKTNLGEKQQNFNSIKVQLRRFAMPTRWRYHTISIP